MIIFRYIKNKRGGIKFKIKCLGMYSKKELKREEGVL